MKKYFKKKLNKKIIEKRFNNNKFIIFFSNLFLNVINIKKKLIIKSILKKYFFLKTTSYIFSNINVIYTNMQLTFLQHISILNQFIFFIFFNNLYIFSNYLFLFKNNIKNFFLLINFSIIQFLKLITTIYI